MEAGEHQDGSFPNAEPATNADEHSKLIQIDSLENGPNSDPKVTSECKPDEILLNLQNVTYIYRQDVVKSKADGKVGIVTEVAGDSDSDSSLTDDEDDDEDDGEEDDDDDDGSNDDGDSSTEGDLDNNEKVGDDGGDDDGDCSTEGDLDNNEKVGDDGGDDDGDSNMEGHLDNNEKAGETADGNKDCSNYKSDPLTADHVRVFWMDESESTESIDDVTVIDRGFLHGDYVAAASDPTGQVGLVVDINISVDLLTHDGSIFKNISSRELKRVRDFTVGDYVVFGPWLGRIDDVFDNVTVMFDDGSVCKVMKVDPLRLKPVGRNGLEEAHFPYYPGQRVKASSSSVFKNSRWLSGVWKANKAEGTVTKVTVGSVLIYWIASAGYGPDSSTAPAEEQNPKNLKLLSCFSHSIWQLGDWCLLPSLPVSSSLDLDKQLSKLQLCDSTRTVSESSQSGADCDSEVVSLEESTGNSESVEIDVESSLDETLERNPPAESAASANSLSVSKESGQESWPLHRKKIRKVVVRRDKKARKKEENFERALLIVNTRTLVDVAWQDGKIERGLESTSLIPIESPGDHEFVAEQYVVEKAADDAEDSNDVRRVGVVKSVNAKERTATVRWLKLVTRAEDPREFDKEEVVSVYELEGHPDYDYCYGDLVVRLSPVSLPAKVGDVVKSAEEESERHLVPTKEKEDDPNHLRCKKTEATPSDDTCSEISDLSWVGNITGLRDGDIEVTWADGMISTVGPQAIYVVDRDDDESMAAGSDGADDAASWETVEDNERETLENAKEELGTVNATDISIEDEAGAMGTENSGRNGALAFPLAALGFVTRLASGIFSRGHKQTSSLDSRSEDEEIEGASTRKDTGDGSCSQRCGDLDNSPRLPAAEKGEEHDAMEVTELDIIEANQKLGIGNSSDQHVSGTYNFKRFDITKDPYDHYFLGASGQSYAGRKWLKKVQQDWNILQNNLPDGIYVRVYEDQMDLLRAVVVGAYGTPYQDGLFFFDFHLPPEYPDVPPSAYYHSGGWRINPNLYEEGKVCLSLLNTWTGRGNEVWDPSSSSILQVLVSLQGLVLNSRPYFNEAGYDKQVGTAEGEKNSLSYNENTFLLNCKTMMYLMRKPPKDFEELIKEHFRMRGYYILKACDAYMKGFLIGSLRKDASISSNNDANSNSVGFKLMMAKIVPKLVLALSEIGVDCEEFKYLHQL